MKRITAIAFLALGLAFAFTATGCQDCCTKNRKAKYVFLFIGDGMGNAHVAVTESYLSYKAGKLGGEHLLFTQFPYYGTATTHSANRIVTCSSAAGTAIATGCKTNNGMLGVAPDLQPLKSMAYDFQEEGYGIGIISSVPVNHATPASFYAQSPKRSDYYDITKFMASSGFEYFAGAGILQYYGKDGQQQSSSEWLEENGINVCFGKPEFEEAMKTDDRLFLCQPYNKDKEPSNYELSAQKPEGEVTLAEMVKYGIDFLGDSQPFFIMCEGGEIDWASHDNKTMPMVMTTIGFDQAIAVAYEFYQKHPDETLIVVTADHETGGVVLGAGSHHSTINWEYMDSTWVAQGHSNMLSVEDNAKLNKKSHIGWTTFSHTGGAVPVYAIGKGADRFSGSMDNTDIKGKILCTKQ